MGKLDGKVALITGGAGGIGKATALLFAQQGARLVLADRDEARNEQAVHEVQMAGGEAIAVTADVSKVGDVRDMINTALDVYRRVDILMNNAGAGSPPAPVHAIDDDDWSRVIDICLKGVFLGMKYILPQMMEQGGGAIINVASIAGIVGAPGLAPYAAAKAGVIELTKTVAVEYSRYNVRCNALAPGWTRTNMMDVYLAGQDDGEQRLLKSIPMRRFGDAGEIAHAALFLAGDDAQFVQGHTLVLDGGITII